MVASEVHSAALTIQAELREAVEGYFSRWGDLDVERVTECWDHDALAIYIAEELDDVLVGWEAIASHVARTRSRLSRVDLELRRFWARDLLNGLGLVVFVLRWDLSTVESQNTHNITHTRVSAVLRRKPTGWKFIHYMEEPYFMGAADDDGSNFVSTIVPEHR